MRGVPFVAEASRLKSAGLALGAALFVAVCLWGLGFFGPTERAMSPLLGWAGIAFFGLCFVVALPRVLRSGPVIRIDTTGIWWRDWSDRTIPWSEIRAAWPGSVKGQKFLCLELRDPERYPPRGLFRVTAGINRGMGFGDVPISTTGTNARFDALVDAVRGFRPGLFDA